MKQVPIFTTKREKTRRLKIHLIHPKIENSFPVVEYPKLSQSLLIPTTHKSSLKTNLSELGL